LKIQTEAREDHQIKLIVEVEQELLDRKMHKAARHISEHNKFPGFRPGKAPYDIVLRYAGEERVQQEAIEMLVEEIYPEMLKQENIEPGAMGTLEDVISTNPPKFSFIIPLKPSVTLGDYKAVRVPYVYPGVSDKDVQAAVERFRSSYATYEPVDRAAVEDDILSITYSAVDITAGGEEAIFADRPLQIRIQKSDEEREAEHPFPGFSRKFLKAKAGFETDLEYDYPADYLRQDLKGKKVRYHVKVDAVKQIVLPEVNEAFIQNFGDFHTVEDFTAEVRKQLDANNQAEYDYEYFKQVIDSIKATATIQYPPQVLDQEKEEVLHNIEHDLSHQRMDLEAYLKVRHQSVDEFLEKEVTPAAKERLERTLILNELARAEKIELTNDELQASYMETLNEMAGTPEFQRLQKKKGPQQNEMVNAIAMEAASRAMNKRVYAAMKRIANNEPEVLPEQPGAAETADPAAAAEEVKPKPRKTKKAETPQEG
jgi:trigger factor